MKINEAFQLFAEALTIGFGFAVGVLLICEVYGFIKGYFCCG